MQLSTDSKVFEINEDVDFETGNIESSLDVHVGGTIRDRSVVKSEKSISVQGAIEAATVEAQGDVIVGGGVVQRGNGSVSSGGDIVAKFCDGARLRAVGNVKISKELIDGRVHCKEKLLVQGAVVGGQIYAREGVEVATLGSNANVTTQITIGIDPNVVREVDRLRASLKPKRLMVERIRKNVQPLMDNLKRLTPDQKERATELIFQADEVEADIQEASKQHADILEKARAKNAPYCLVSQAVHPGVRIQIGHRETTFCKDVKGPIRIEKRKIKAVTEFVAVDQLSGSVTVLASSRVVK